MNQAAAPRGEVVVAGFGSAHGDDQAGWKVVERLQARFPVCAETNTVRIVRVREGTQLVCQLESCEKLIVVDACLGSGTRGTISRFEWPDPRIRRYHSRSTHEVGLQNALELAQQLGRLPPQVCVFGIEIGSDEPAGAVSGEVLRAVDELEAVLAAEIHEVVHA